MLDTYHGFPNSGLDIQQADLVRCRFVVRYKEQDFRLEHSPTVLSVYFGPHAEPAGLIKCGSSSSGAIWSYGRCIGDFSQEPDGNYYVTRINANFLEPEATVQADPVMYLLNSLLETCSPLKRQSQ